MSYILKADTSHAIQLAIAPAFVLAAIGSTLTVLTNRLARIDDHAEKLRNGMKQVGEPLSKDNEARTGTSARALALLDRRAKLIHFSISCAVVCGLLICAMVMATFTGDEFGLATDRVIAVLFGTAMASLALTYAAFLIEVYLGAHMLKPDRPLSVR